MRNIDHLILAAALAPAMAWAQAPAVDASSEPVPIGTVALAMLAGVALRGYSLRQTSQRSLPLKTGMESATSSSATQTK